MLPARAGMILTISGQLLPDHGAPRASGDDPFTRGRRTDSQFVPRAIGDFQNLLIRQKIKTIVLLQKRWLTWLPRLDSNQEPSD